jgi:hypothetical protein
MEYLNQFHKESAERKMKKVKEWLKNPIPASEALREQSEIHREIDRIYGNKNNNSNLHQKNRGKKQKLEK